MTNPTTKRASFCLSAGLVFALLSSGCASAALAEPVAALADDLMRSLEQRKDPRTMMVLVYEIHEVNTSNPHSGQGGDEEAHIESEIGTRLEHELVVALSGKVNIVESEHADGRSAGPGDAGLRELAESYGANAVLAGDFVEKQGELHVTLRIVDIESMLIVAAASSMIPRSSLGQDLVVKEN
jgi:FlgO protein